MSIWMPASAMQELALSSPARFLLLGGSKGSLKTSTLLMDGIAFRDRPKARSILFRRTVPELQQTIERAGEMFRDYGAEQWEGGRRWEFPSGMQFYIRGAGENEADIFKYQGWELDWIGFDESTQFTEKPIRTLLHSQRAKAGDTFLQENLRFRLGTNPGFVGATWHKHVFIGDGCWHCKRKPGTKNPGKMYTDATWMDGTPIGLTTCFLPGRVSDHNLYDAQDYENQMRGFSVDMRRKFREGCWESLEGLYFDCWDETRMVVDARHYNPQWWWTQWTGTDYGFSGSAAATIRFARFIDKERPEFKEGRTLALAEYVERRETAKRYGQSIYERWYAPNQDSEANRIVASYLGPDCFSGGRGHEDDRSLCEQMEDGADGRIHFDRASNDRAAGNMHWFSMLESGELLIDKSCTNLIACCSSRERSQTNPLDIQKRPGDHLDDVADACLVAGTMVETANGPVAIEHVRIGDLVLTRQGFRPVTWAGLTKRNATTNTVEFNDGSMLIGTGSHPIWVEDHGFVPLDSTRYGDKILACAHVSKRSSSTGSHSDDTLTPNRERIASITALADQTVSEALDSFTKKSGRLRTAQSRLDTIFITLTKIPATTLSLIFRAFAVQNILVPITRGSVQPGYLNTSPKFDHWLRNGIDQPKAVLGTGVMEEGYGKGSLPRLAFASTAVANTLLANKVSNRGSVPTSARHHGDASPAWTTLRKLASTVANCFGLTSTTGNDSAPTHVLSFGSGPIADVYNLEVADVPEYFANGILVHNCRYGLFSHLKAGKKPNSVVMAELAEEIRDQPAHERAMQLRAARAKIDKEENQTTYYINREPWET